MTPEELDALTAHDDLEELFVSPRHLAGSRADGDGAIRPLLNAGWSHRYDELGNVYVDSPCMRVRVAFTPEGDDIGLWHVTAATLPMHLPKWKMVADAQVPIEAVAGFTTALAASVTAEGDEFLVAPLGATPGWYPLSEAGWRERFIGTRATFVSPEGAAQLICNRSPSSYAGEMSSGPHAWDLVIGDGRYRDHATFTSDTPAHLIAAFSTALADPAPVPRTRRELPKEHLRYLTAALAITADAGPESACATAAASRSTTGAKATPTVPTLPTGAIVAAPPRSTAKR
ncbi:DUF317 domain-containing protein [Embleya sp. NPDC059237]|uniref:DUF317 domain-containing protein n=1 Tax=unclassified Embleya TaxID=2699296 RepID=UPI0036ADBED3